MKNYKLILLAVVGACTFSACSGDHMSDSGKDSVMNHTDVPSNLDTFRVTNTMGEASMVESGGSGGAHIKKDTTHMKVRSVPVTATSTPVPAATAAPADSTAKAATPAATTTAPKK